MNGTRGLVLAETIEPAFESKARRRGLLGRESLPSRTVLAIAPSNAVHTFGMRFAIDVLFINRTGRVTKRVLGMKPGRVTAALTAFAVLEFAVGDPAVASTVRGDQLVLV